ncbi:hypothetical protein MKZ38_009617 [Zalerion maritima]|uniref:NTF2-like domain-containing protein n=1 Tax=Zalerion maritima TaxID=339359 RepID=A0AAD5RGP3_9PEZI|nr:hypothetical protein MKZ38_009617 [Zalerion maritima]
MRFSTLVTLGSALVGTAMSAACAHKKCMSKDEMSAAIDKYAAFISDYQEDVGLEFLAEDFEHYSDGINTLTSKDLGSQTFNKTSFMAGAAAAKAFGAVYTINVMDVYMTTCDMAALSWYAVFSHSPDVERELPARGITVLGFERNPDFVEDETDEWQVKLMTLEFNSLVWLLNSGGDYEGVRPGTQPEEITVEEGVYPDFDELDQPEPSVAGNSTAKI